MKELVIGVLSITLFGLMWWGLVRLIAATGWKKLANHFETPQRSPEGRRFKFASVVLQKNTQYKNCVTFTIAEEGLHLQMALPFRAGHPPLLIPWQKFVEVNPIQRFSRTLYRIEIETLSGEVMLDIPENVLIASKKAIVNMLN